MFTINRYTENRFIVGTTSGTLPLPFVEMSRAVDKAIRDFHVCLLLANKQVLVVNTALMYSSFINEASIPYAWRRVLGIIVGNCEQAERVIVELEKLKMWAILKQ